GIETRRVPCFPMPFDSAPSTLRSGRTVWKVFGCDRRTAAVESTPTLRDLFEHALSLAPEARARMLAERCGDPGVRAELDRLLAADAEQGDWLEPGDAASAAQTIGETEDDEPLPAGSRIGPFELLEVLGEGGSSTVFRAFRDVEGVRQHVAVKLLARGLYTAEARRR